MAGPKAPKDPTAKGSSFFVCRQKGVAGNPTPDGKGVQFIYLDNGRLVTFARMNGNVTDDSMLKALTNAKEFMNMVAGIGVTVDAEDREQEIHFVFQMYGKTDPNNSGSVLRVPCKPDSMEQIIWLDDYSWNEDDNVPGQFRFEFGKAGGLASVDIRFYLREGFTAPEQEECNKVDTASADYKAMIARSLMQTGNNARVKKVLEKAKRGEDVTIAFIGGSITQGAGAIPISTKSYAYQTYEKFKALYGCGENVHLIKAGVGGTPSELGMIRFDRDVLRDGAVSPDLVVIEFAVNDEGDETKGRCFECLVRKALSLSEDTAVVLMFAVFVDGFNLQERLGPVGERYMLPMVSAKNAVDPQFYLKSGEGRVLTKSQYFYDMFHPTNLGHMIMADGLMELFRTIDEAEADAPMDWQQVTPVFGTDFTNVKLLDKKSHTEKTISLSVGSFCETDTELQGVEMDANPGQTPEFPYNWQHVSGAEPFRMQINCKALLLVGKDTGAIDCATISVHVDGEEKLVYNPREVGWTHCNAMILFSEEESKDHTVEISVVPGDEDKKVTILGFGYVD